MKHLLLLTLVCFALFSCSKDSPKEPEPIAAQYAPSIISPEIFHFGQSTQVEVEIGLSPGYIGDDLWNNPDFRSIELFLDGASCGKKTARPYTFDIELSTQQLGDHSLTATVIFTDGSSKNASEKTFKYVVQEGDSYGGGIIIKISDGGMHGTVAAKNDLEGGILGKYKYGAYNGGYEAYSMDDGLANTQKFSGKTDANYAAIACLKLDLNGHDDWYLPSYNELALFEPLRESLNIPERGGNVYWSSTGSSTDPTKVYAYSFGGMMGNPGDIQTYHHVRPCRKF